MTKTDLTKRMKSEAKAYNLIGDIRVSADMTRMWGFCQTNQKKKKDQTSKTEIMKL